MKPVIIKNKEILSRVYLCTKNFNKGISKEQYINNITRDINDTAVGYAGFSKKRNLKEFLFYQVFDNDDSLPKTHQRKIPDKDVLKIIEKTLNTVKQILPSRQTRIYVFSSFSTFTKQKMGGTSGYTPWKDVMLIFIDPTTDWKKSLSKTIAHEYIHTLSRQHHKWDTLEDSLIFEGLAENFVQHVFKEELSPWSSALSLNDSKKYFKKIQNKLSSTDWSLYREVFFKNSNYPLWTGYAIGYHLVREYMEKQNEFSWQKLIEIKPSKITRGSNFTK